MICNTILAKEGSINEEKKILNIINLLLLPVWKLLQDPNTFNLAL